VSAAVTVEEMVSHRGMFIAAAVKAGVCWPFKTLARSTIKRRASASNGSDVGLFVHPVLGVDALTGECLGPDVQVSPQRGGGAIAAPPIHVSLPVEDVCLP
jgi:hypothetical protein